MVRVMVLGAILVLVCGCEPGIYEGQFTCDPTEAEPCPDGWYCLMDSGEQAHHCYRNLYDRLFECVDGIPEDCPPRWRCLPYAKGYFCYTADTTHSCDGREIEPGEECDGTHLGGNTCENGGTPVCDPETCLRKCPRCGNGIFEDGEQCDDGNNDDGDGCSSTCLFETCGNSVIDFGEECDDGGTAPGDGCGPTCLLEACGNGVVDPGEECDNGEQNSDTLPDACRSDCSLPHCVDGVQDTDETCTVEFSLMFSELEANCYAQFCCCPPNQCYETDSDNQSSPSIETGTVTATCDASASGIYGLTTADATVERTFDTADGSAVLELALSESIGDDGCCGAYSEASAFAYSIVIAMNRIGRWPNGCWPPIFVQANGATFTMTIREGNMVIFILSAGDASHLLVLESDQMVTAEVHGQGNGQGGLWEFSVQ